MIRFALHPDPRMGLYVAISDDPLTAGQEVEWAFELTDDDMSTQYRAFRDSQTGATDE